MNISVMEKKQLFLDMAKAFTFFNSIEEEDLNDQYYNDLNRWYDDSLMGVSHIKGDKYTSYCPLVLRFKFFAEIEFIDDLNTDSVDAKDYYRSLVNESISRIDRIYLILNKFDNMFSLKTFSDNFDIYTCQLTELLERLYTVDFVRSKLETIQDNINECYHKLISVLKDRGVSDDAVLNC